MIMVGAASFLKENKLFPGPLVHDILDWLPVVAIMAVYAAHSLGFGAVLRILVGKLQSLLLYTLQYIYFLKIFVS